MSLFDMCCPRKPKKSLDYVIKWVEDTDKTVNDLVTDVEELNKWKGYISTETLTPIFDEYAETYHWDSVPEFNAKADKVENATVGHLAALDSSGNLVDSGVGSNEIKAPGAFANYAYARIESGASAPAFKLKVGGANDISAQVEVNVGNIENLRRALTNPSTTVPEDDDTKLITSKAVYNYSPRALSNAGYGVSVDADGEVHIGSDYVVISVDGGEAEINSENIDNLNRALEAPDNTPASGSDNLITSNAVYGALSGKASSSSVNSLSARIGLLESYLLTNKCTIQVDITRGYDGTNYYYIIKNGGNNVVSASTAEYVTLQNIDDIFRLAKTGDTIGITTTNGNVILSGTISEKSLGAIKVSSAFDDQYVETFFPGTGTLTLSVSTQS